MILSRLRIHGISTIQEEAILAGLLSGEPILLIGPPGTAKTEIVNAIGAALREDSKRSNPDGGKIFDYQVYDASKVNFEDLFGIPDIKALQQDPPQVRYIKTPSSIWGKELIAFDELNRCPEDRQSNLFEILRSRKLHGVPTGNLFMFSTINPFGDVGTIEMSDALVDRHMLYLKFNHFQDMSPDDRKQIISRVGDKEGVGFSYWGGDKSEFTTEEGTYNPILADVGKDIRTLLRNAAQYKLQLSKSLTDGLVQVIDKVVENMAKKFGREEQSIKTQVSISGRRASSVCRAILAVRAVQLASKKENQELPDIMSTIINTIKLALPIGIGGKLNQDIVDRANKEVEETVKAVWPAIKIGKDTVHIDLINEIMSTNNPIKILDALLSTNLNTLTKETAFSYLLDKKKYSSTNQEKLTKLEEDTFNRIKVLLYSINETIPGFLPPHINLNLTTAAIETAQAKDQTEMDKIIIDYKFYIETMLKAYQQTPLIYYTAKVSLLYYWPNVKTDQMAIESLVATKRLADSVSKKLLMHKTATTTNVQPDNNPIT